MNISNNSIIHYEEEQAKAAGKALSNALAQNTVLKELDLSNNAPYFGSQGPAFAKEFAAGLGTNGAMAKFTFSGYTYKEGPPVTIETSMTEADFSSKKLGPSGAIMLAAFLPKCQ